MRFIILYNMLFLVRLAYFEKISDVQFDASRNLKILYFMGMRRKETSLTTFSVYPLITNLVEIDPVVTKVNRLDG